MRFAVTVLMGMVCVGIVQAQPAARVNTQAFSRIDWNNYSTSFQQDGPKGEPFLVTAIPYNGNYENFENFVPGVDQFLDSAHFYDDGVMPHSTRCLYTFDSSDVYFLVPYITPANAHLFEYRVILDGTSDLLPWQSITRFSDPDFQLNNFNRRMAFLGGVDASWDHWIEVQLRKVGSRNILSAAIVYWKQTKPAILNIYTGSKLNEFLYRVKNPYLPLLPDSTGIFANHPATDPATGLPTDIHFPAGEENIVFFLAGNIYRKQAIEYQLLRNGKVIIPWKANDFDNNFVWLKKPGGGRFVLQIRFSAQRNNVTNCPFRIAEYWYQHSWARWLLAAIVAALLLLIYKYISQRRKTIMERRRRERLRLELQVVRSQLNPHFVFNALASIQGLINQNDTEQANHYLTEFSNLLRETLQNRNRDFIPLSKEMQMIETYLQLEQLRFHFGYRVVADPGVDTGTVEIPSLLIQPLVENAIRHGAAPLYEKGQVGIRFSTSGTDLRIVISDNGNGFEHSKTNNGVGLQLVQERIKLLNETDPERKIHLDYQSSSARETLVILLFQNWLPDAG